MEVYWDNCKCAFIARNLTQSVIAVEVTVTFVLDVKWEARGGVVRLNPGNAMNHCTPNVAEDQHLSPASMRWQAEKKKKQTC